MRTALAILGLLALSCGHGRDVEDAAEDEPSDLAEMDTWDGTDTGGTDTRSEDPPADETDPPLGLCGDHCEGEYMPCPEGAFCEYGIFDPTFICTNDGCGFCVWVPEECPPEDEPDCGCDGVVYPNPCERRRVRMLPDPSWMSCAHPEEEPDY